MAHELFSPGFSVVPTRRRRFFWAAWWTAPPQVQPFQRPDASSGGAESEEEARAAAEAAAGQPLAAIDPRWAGAWIRVVRGEAPFRRAWDPAEARVADGSPFGAPRARVEAPPLVGSPSWARARLGVAADASAEDVKRAFRALALVTHPDRGGDEQAFIDAKRALDVALRAVNRPARARRGR